MISPAARIRLSYFLVFCCTASWLPLLADYCVGRGLTPVQVSVVLSITPVSMFLFQPVAGLLADRFGFKQALVISTFLATLSYLGFLLVHDFTTIVLVAVAMSIFYNAVQPILDSISMQCSKKDPRISYGKLRVAGAIGWSFTGWITGQMIEQINLDVIFWISSITMFLCFLSIFTLPFSDREQYDLEKIEMRGAIQLLRNIPLLLFLLAVFLVSLAGTAIWNYYSLFMKSKGADQQLIGYGLSLQGLCEIPFFYFSGWIIQRTGLKFTLLITIIATALRLFLYSWINDPLLLLPIELLHGVSWSLFWVVGVEFVNRIVPSVWTATGQSLLYASYYGIGAIAGNLWAGFMLDSGVELNTVFQLNTVFVILAFVLSAIAIRTNPQN